MDGYCIRKVPGWIPAKVGSSIIVVVECFVDSRATGVGLEIYRE